MHESNIRPAREAVTGETRRVYYEKPNKQRILYTTNELW